MILASKPCIYLETVSGIKPFHKKFYVRIIRDLFVCQWSDVTMQM